VYSVQACTSTQCCSSMDWLNIKTPKLDVVFTGVHRLEIQSIMLVFSDQLSSSPLSCSPPLPHPKVKVQYIQTVCVWEGVGGCSVVLCWRPHLQELNTLYLTRFRTYKIALPPQTKTWTGGGLRQINTCHKVPWQVNFFKNETWHCFLRLIFLRAAPSTGFEFTKEV
jgi:hypothetical protein